MTTKHWLTAPLVAATAVALTAGACGGDRKNDGNATPTTRFATTSSTAAPMPGAVRIITERENNSTQTLPYNPDSSEQGMLRINLQTAGGSGYTWEITKQPDAKIVSADAPTQEPTKPRPTTADGTPLVGAPETVSTLLTAAGVGTTSIELGLVGPSGGKPEKTFKVTIVVN